MGTEYTLGRDCKLYRLSAPLSALPTGAENWVEMENVKDVSVPISVGEADVTTRASGSFKMTASVLKDASITIGLEAKDGDADLLAIETAWVAGTQIGLAAMSGDIDAGGSRGLAGNFVVTGFNREEPLVDAARYSVTVKPSSYAKWLIIAS